MTLPLGGPILWSAIRAEIGFSGPIGLGDGNVRSLAGVLSGPISAAACYGKSGAGGGGGGGTSMTAVGNSADVFDAPTGSQFTATVSPSVTAAGGSGSYTYLWTIATQSDTGFSLTNASAAVCSVKHLIGRFGYSGTCTLTCVVTDSVGHTVTVTGVVASFDYESV